MKVADAIADSLRSAGTKRVYGVPGDDHLGLLDAFANAGLQYVLARNESSACIMASVEAQITGIPGVLAVCLGPGLTNAINGLANAYLDHLPLLVFAGQHSRSRHAVTIRQVLDSHRLVAGVTKWSVSAGESIHQLLARATAIAMARPKGPVFIELSEEVGAAESVDEAAPWQNRSPTVRGAATQGSAAASREAVATKLKEAHYPVAIIGDGDFDPQAHSLLLQALRAYRIPTFTAPDGKGWITASSEWFAGTFVGGNLEAQILDRADLILTLNLRAGGIFNRPWPYRSYTIALTDSPDVEQFFPRAQEVCGDVGELLERLVAGEAAGESRWTAHDVQDYRDAVRGLLQDGLGSRLTLGSAIGRARATLPRDASIVVDAGFSKVLLALLWDSTEPGTYFASHGLSTMGYAIPATNAVKLVEPHRVTVGFMGDGSLLMRASEIGVATALGISPIYVAWVDGRLTQIALKQERAGLSTVGVQLPPSSCERIAGAFGADGYDVHSTTEFEHALQRAMAADRPSLIGVHVDTSSVSSLFEALRG